MYFTATSFNVTNANAQDIAKLNLALAYLQQSSYASGMIYSVYNKSMISTIEITRGSDTTYNSATKVLKWNPDSGLQITFGQTTAVQSAALGLLHEIAHAFDPNIYHTTREKAEAFATAQETIVANELGEPVRQDYTHTIGEIFQSNPSQHTIWQNGFQTWFQYEQWGGDTVGGSYNPGSSWAPTIGPSIDPFTPQACFGYYEIFEDPTQIDGSGHPLTWTVWIGDPLVMNLKGNSVATTELSDSIAKFDMQGKGNAIHTSWITEDEGFLIYQDSPSAVKNIHDLLPNFSELAKLDSNTDGKISALDIGWNNLKVWMDAGVDGEYHTDELFTMKQLSIAEIRLDYKTINFVSNGNFIESTAEFIFEDGAAGSIAKVDLITSKKIAIDLIGIQQPESGESLGI